MVRSWGAQSKISIDRLTDELRQRFIATAEGAGLRELAAEPDFGSLTFDESPTYAVGEATITRSPGVTITGVIPVGTRFRRRGNPSAVPIPIAAAEYVTTQPVIVVDNQVNVTLPVRAVSSGPAANIVPELGVTNSAGVELASTLFDTETGAPISDRLVVSAFTAGGGSAGLTDDDVRRIMRGQAGGNFGPTDAAIRAGALRGTGVKRLAAFRSVYDDDAAYRPNTRVFAADASWGSSALWRAALVQMLQDQWAGFGCRVTAGIVTNVFVRVEATIQLRSSRLLGDTSAASAAGRSAVRAFFDDRPDFYQWTHASLRSAITTASRDILTCTSVVVKDRDGNVLSEPTVDQSTATSVNHYYLLGDGLVPTFVGPA